MRHTDVLDGFATRSREAVRDFTAWVESTRNRLTEHPEAPLQPWADQLIDHIGYIPELRRAEKTAEAADNRVRNLKDLIHSLDARPDPDRSAQERLQDFLEDLTLDSEREEDKETSGDLVTLITMHSCKGLEFPHVYVVGLEDGLLPHARSKVEGTLDEERRLFYVALTRAMKTLDLSFCLGRKKYGETVPCHPSPFLGELPEELIEHAHEKARQPVAVQSGKSMFSAMRNSLEPR
jgi:superfamily I DNA/RNA helicase